MTAHGPLNEGRWHDSVDGNEDVTDYFRFTLTSERFVGIGLRFQDANADIFLEDDAGNTLASSQRGGTWRELIEKRFDAGTYYIRVQARAAGVNEYQLHMSSVRPQAGDPTSDFYTTARVAVGDCFEASDGARIGPHWDIDWVGVVLEAGVSYVLEVRGLDSGSGTLRDPQLDGVLVDTDLQSAYPSRGGRINLARDSDSGTGQEARLSFTAAATGTHFIEVTSYGGFVGTYTVAVAEQDDAPVSCAAISTTLIFTDVDDPGLDVNKSSVSVVEDGAADSFTVALATQPSADVTVTVTSDDPTSAAVSPTQLTFTTDNWDTAQVVTVTGPEDPDADSETPKVTLDPSGGGYDGVENVDVAVTVTDNDTANLEVNKSSVSVVEDGAADSFTVALATQPSADVTVTVTSDDPTSAAVSPTQLTFTTDNWDTAQVVTVTGPEDPDADSETPKVTLDPSGGGYDGVENVDVAVTVTDNDTANLDVNKSSVSVVEDGAADSFTVALATQPSADVTVTVTSDDPTSAAVSPTQLTFTTDNWDTAQVVTVTGPEDPDAHSETPKVTLDPSGGGYDGVENVDVAVTVTDNDTANLDVNKSSVSVVEDGAADSFTVALATQPSADVTVTVTSDDPTSAAVSPTQLMFTTDNWDTAQVVTVTGPEDPDAHSETPKVTLDPSGGGYDGVENVDVAVTVTDNDTANLEVNKSSVSVVEDGAADSFTVALATQPSADVTVTVTSDDPTSAAVSPTQLMFTTDNWDTAQVVTVTGPEDPDADSETPKVTLDPSGGGYDGVDNVDVAVTVTDNDTGSGHRPVVADDQRGRVGQFHCGVGDPTLRGRDCDSGLR